MTEQQRVLEVNDNISSSRDPVSLRDAPHLKLGTRFLLLLGNFIPLLQICVVVVGPLYFASSTLTRIIAALLLLFVLPPMLARIVALVLPLRSGTLNLSERAFFGWWIIFQLQVVFSRLRLLEEALRLIPSFYSLWLRLWGAKIGRLTFWSPGVTILDRSLLIIGDDVVIGAGVTLVPHLFCRSANGQMGLLLAPISIGDQAIVGGYSIVGPGVIIGSDECTEACCILPPFIHYKGGRRVKPTRGSMDKSNAE